MALSAAAEEPRFFAVQRFNQYPGVKDALDSVCALLSLASVGCLLCACKNKAKDRLINRALELLKLVVLGGVAFIWIIRILDLGFPTLSG